MMNVKEVIMRYTRIRLTNNDRVPFSLNNEFSNTFDFVEDVCECSCDDIAKLTRIVNDYSKYTSWKVARDTNKYTRLTSKDCWGNEHFLICYKEER